MKKENIIKTLNKFIGRQKQIPPIYSAIKINGKKLYDYAREGKTVTIEPRRIKIYKIELMGFNKEAKQIQFKVNCSKGTYIRSLCEDIAKKLGTVGYMKELNRTQVGEFYIKDSVTIAELEEKIKKNDLSNIISIEKIFENANKIDLEQKFLNKYLNGVGIEQNYEDGVYKIYLNNEFIGLGIIKAQKLKRDLVLI